MCSSDLRRRRLLVRNQPQEGDGHGVAEGGQGGGVGEVAADDPAGGVGQSRPWENWLTPSLMRRVWKCMPDPAWPTAILGEKDTSLP